MGFTIRTVQRTAWNDSPYSAWVVSFAGVDVWEGAEGYAEFPRDESEAWESFAEELRTTFEQRHEHGEVYR